MKKIAIIFAGGKGERMNIAKIPKQFMEIKNKPILCHTVERFENNAQICGIIVVTAEAWFDYTKDILKNYKKVISVINGGNTALDSQYLGLLELKKILKEENAIVLIHDGVRPLINDKLINDCIDCVIEKGTAITTAPAIETIIRINEQGDIIETMDRNFCQLARAPQAFLFEDIFGTHEKAIKEKKHNFIDSATMMQHYGYTLHSVVGPAENIKVTTAIDFYNCATMLEKEVLKWHIYNKIYL